MDYYQNVPSGIATAHTLHFQGSGDESMPMQRLGRALSNACDPKSMATYSRFAIWGADMNAIVQESMDALASSDINSAMFQLAVLQKNLRAFIDCCSLLDTQHGYMRFETATDILTEIKQHWRMQRKIHYQSMRIHICASAKR